MSTVWNTYRIEDIADKITIGPFGSRMKSDAYVESGVPVIRGTNLTGSKKFSGDWVFISEQLAKQLENCCVSNGDLVFPHRGSIGEVGLVDNQFHQYMMSSSLMKLRCNPNIADSEFIYYFFKSHQGRYELLKNASQVGTPGIGQPLTSLKNIEIKLPSLGEQRKIAKILSDLDDKIHINNQINQTLESIAQALFKSWFVDFDPVRAKIAAKQEGKDAELAAMCAISGKSEIELQQMAEDDFAALRATAALFPDGLVESELGEVPKGWDKYSLSKMITLIGGGTPKRSEPNYWNGDIFWFSVKDVPNEGEVFVITTQEKISELGLNKSSTKLLPVGTTIITARGTVGKIALVGYEMAMNQSCYGVQGINGVRQFMTYYLIKNAVEVLKKNTHGAVFDTITQSTFDTVTSIKPSIEMMDLFESKVEKIMGHIKNNLYENNSLIALRDTLLPKLLSGELDAALLKG